MSVATGFNKYKRYIKLSDGTYKLISQWTSSDTVQMSGSGNTLSTDLGSIRGITDSLTSTSSNIALSAKSGKSLQDQIATTNSNLNNLKDRGDLVFNPTYSNFDQSQFLVFRRIGNLVIVSGNLRYLGSSSLVGDTVIGTLQDNSEFPLDNNVSTIIGIPASMEYQPIALLVDSSTGKVSIWNASPGLEPNTYYKFMGVYLSSKTI